MYNIYFIQYLWSISANSPQTLYRVRYILKKYEEIKFYKNI